MTSPVTIAVDVMGGDRGPSVILPAVLEVLSSISELNIILVGDKPSIERHLASPQNPRLSIVHATQSVLMDEQPVHALRNKKQSSMRLAIDLVQAGKADACVSAGNTGALMMISRFVLKMLPGVDRPAIITSFPTFTDHTYILDLGANVDCTPEHLYQFAVMGATLASVVENLKEPRVGLLNVGSEEIKGNEVVKAASKLLQQQNLIRYEGYVEGDDIFKGKVDVIVCDGFVGNVMLKACEGIAKLIAYHTRQALTQHWFTKVLALPASFLLKDVKNKMDPDKNNGACLLGLNGIVVKSHGGAGIHAFASAIEKAHLLAKNKVMEKISNAFLKQSSLRENE